MSQVRNAFIYSSMATYINKFMALISIIIIARMIPAEEFGVFSIAASVMLIINELRNFGAGNYLIREKTIDQRMVNLAFTLTILICWSLALVMLVFANGIESYFGYADLADLLLLFLIALILTPYNSIRAALMRKEFRFGELSIIEVSSRFIMMLLIIIMLYLDFSYYAMAYANAAMALTQFFLLRRVGNQFEHFGVNFKGLGTVFKFGGFVSISQLLSRVKFTLPELVIGKLGSSTDVAMYSRANGFLDFLSSTVAEGARPVVAPYFAKAKNQSNSLNSAFILATSLLCSIAWPVLMVASVSSYPVVLFFFGENWLPAVELVTVLSFAFLFKSALFFTPSLFITSGKEKLLFIKEVITVCCYFVILYFAYRYGLRILAMAVVAAAALEFLLTLAILKWFIDLSIFQLGKALMGSVLTSVVCVTVTLVLDSLIDFKVQSVWVSVLLLLGLNSFIWLAVSYLLNNKLALMMVNMFKLKLNWNKNENK